MKILATTVLPLLAAYFTVATRAPQSCPYAEDLAPCTCRRMAYGLHAVCANLDKMSDLTRVFQVLRDYKVQNVLLHGLVLADALPVDLFNGSDICALRIEKSQLTFPEPAFAGLDGSLQTLDIARSTIGGPEGISLSTLSTLTDLNVKAVSLVKVRKEWLNGKVPNVKNIVLEEDEIVEIENEAFYHLQHLEKISLSDNKIKIIQRRMFARPARTLTAMDLSHNELEMLPYDIFFDMPMLTDVVLSGNLLTTLEERNWQPVWEQLQSVLLFENNLICDDSMDWLRKSKWPYHVSGNCVAPSHLVGKSLEDVYRHFSPSAHLRT